MTIYDENRYDTVSGSARTMCILSEQAGALLELAEKRPNWHLNTAFQPSLGLTAADATTFGVQRGGTDLDGLKAFRKNLVQSKNAQENITLANESQVKVGC
jgi:hypothetical protein